MRQTTFFSSRGALAEPDTPAALFLNKQGFEVRE